MRFSSSVVAYSMALAPMIWAAPIMERMGLVFQQTEETIDLTAVEAVDSNTHIYPVDKVRKTIRFPDVANAQLLSKESLWAYYQQSLAEHMESQSLEAGPSESEFVEIDHLSSQPDALDETQGWTLIIGQGYDDDDLEVIPWQVEEQGVADMEVYADDLTINPDDYLVTEDFVPPPIEPVSTLEHPSVVPDTTDSRIVSTPIYVHSPCHSTDVSPRYKQSNCPAASRIERALRSLRPIEASIVVFLIGIGGGLLIQLLCSLVIRLISIAFGDAVTSRTCFGSGSCSRRSGQISLGETVEGEKQDASSEAMRTAPCSCAMGTACV